MPKISFHPPMPMMVRAGEHVQIFCNVSGEHPIRVRWHSTDERQPLPNSVRVDNQYLIFPSIAPADAGQYSCSASNVHGNVTKVAEVLVNRKF